MFANRIFGFINALPLINLASFTIIIIHLTTKTRLFKKLTHITYSAFIRFIRLFALLTNRSTQPIASAASLPVSATPHIVRHRLVNRSGAVLVFCQHKAIKLRQVITAQV